MSRINFSSHFHAPKTAFQTYVANPMNKIVHSNLALKAKELALHPTLLFNKTTAADSIANALDFSKFTSISKPGFFTNSAVTRHPDGTITLRLRDKTQDTVRVSLKSGLFGYSVDSLSISRSPLFINNRTPAQQAQVLKNTLKLLSTHTISEIAKGNHKEFHLLSSTRLLVRNTIALVTLPLTILGAIAYRMGSAAKSVFVKAEEKVAPSLVTRVKNWTLEHKSAVAISALATAAGIVSVYYGAPAYISESLSSLFGSNPENSTPPITSTTTGQVTATTNADGSVTVAGTAVSGETVTLTADAHGASGTLTHNAPPAAPATNG